MEVLAKDQYEVTNSLSSWCVWHSDFDPNTSRTITWWYKQITLTSFFGELHRKLKFCPCQNSWGRFCSQVLRASLVYCRTRPKLSRRVGSRLRSPVWDVGSRQRRLLSDCSYYVQPLKASNICTFLRSGRQSVETPPSSRQSVETPTCELLAVGRDASSQSCSYYVRPYKASNICTSLHFDRRSLETPGDVYCCVRMAVGRDASLQMSVLCSAPLG